MNSSPQQTISAKEAEEVVQQRIEQFGTAALPDLHVANTQDGMWCVRWQEHERIVQPMTSSAWCEWLEEHVGPLDAALLVTTES